MPISIAFTKVVMTAAVLVMMPFSRGGAAVNSKEYTESLKTWRDQQETRLRSETGWLTVVGLTWLKEGKSAIGSKEGLAVVLPKSAPANLGEIQHSASGSSIKFKTVAGVSIDGKPAAAGRSYPMKEDTTGKPTEVKVGSVTFFLIKRKNGVGVRIKDTESDLRKKFAGRRWFDADPGYVIEAKWTELKEPKSLLVPDILGNVNEENSPGFVTFTRDGQTVTLYPTKDETSLFFVFRDQSSGKETYGAGRFLSTDLPKNGVVTLDFNKAVNPPCAFTSFATCPIPPKENRAAVAIRAGERPPEGH